MLFWLFCPLQTKMAEPGNNYSKKLCRERTKEKWKNKKKVQKYYNSVFDSK